MGATSPRYVFLPCCPLINIGFVTFLTLGQEMSDRGVSANEWAAVVSGIVGGKAGGKGSTSIGNGVNSDKVDEAIAQASDYLSRFKL